ncbi:amino acid permease-domain-containing protein [Hypoxylon sp. NC1633]|nr:amino acid permease-domain-containing protein [Hypoxylon sp. NC1633]
MSRHLTNRNGDGNQDPSRPITEPMPLREIPVNPDPKLDPHLRPDSNSTHATSFPSNGEIDEDGHTYETLLPAQANAKRRRMTHRKLLPIHVFMITVNATLGTGLYWRGGQILGTGGSLAVILSFLMLGILAWGVMQCISELLCLWPVPGALSVFVREFVDFELGIVVGVAYWFTYSTAFATLIATSAAEIHYWADHEGLDAGVVYLLVPLILVVVNSFGIEIYGWLEVVAGIIKLFFLSFIIEFTKTLDWDNPTFYDHTVANNWGHALLICLSTATFSYVGVEVPAAAALEARPTKSQRNPPVSSQGLSNATNIGETVRFTAKWVSVFTCIVYTLSGILVSLSVSSTDCELPRLDTSSFDCSQPNMTPTIAESKNATSAFVIVPEKHNYPGMASAFNGFLLFTALTCANTNLYVASRTLFGLTNRIDGGSNERWYLNVLAWLGRTNSYRVPIRAMTVSAFAFIWVPFLQLAPQGNNGVYTFIGVLAEMGSVGVLIVWACECWAFIRFYHCITRHKSELIDQKVPRVQRSSYEEGHDYPYLSNGQPVTAYLSLIACLTLLLVINGASLWKSFNAEPFLSSYLIVIGFIALWALLKLWRGAKWSLIDLSDSDRAIKIIRGLNEYSFAGFQNEPPSNADRGSSLWPLSLIAKNLGRRHGGNPSTNA